MYALMAETFHEMLLMLPRQSITSISMAQKYFGQLLYNQRQELDIEIFSTKEVHRFKNLRDMLAQELHQNKIIRTSHLHQKSDEVHYHY